MTKKLNDVLHLSDEDIQRTKFRFMVKSKDFNPTKYLNSSEDIEELNRDALVCNRKKSIPFREGVIAIGFIPNGNKDEWLLTGIVEVIKDNGRAKRADARKYKTDKFNRELTVRFHKASQNGIYLAKRWIDKIEVI